MSFLNEDAINNPLLGMLAQGCDVNPNEDLTREFVSGDGTPIHRFQGAPTRGAGGAILSTNGTVLMDVTNGGILSPTRYELEEGTEIFRFGHSKAKVNGIKTGLWWVERPEFNKLTAFSQQTGVSLGAAVRILCMVPPDWSDLGTLIRCRVDRPLLALRGLGKPAFVSSDDDAVPNAQIRSHNDNPARRLHQLFVPGLNRNNRADRALSITQVLTFSPEEQTRGFLYV